MAEIEPKKSFQEIIEERLAATGHPPLNKKGWKSAQDLFSSEVNRDPERTEEDIRFLNMPVRGYHPIDDRRPKQFGVTVFDLLKE